MVKELETNKDLITFSNILLVLIGFLYTFRGEFTIISELTLFSVLLLVYFVYTILFNNSILQISNKYLVILMFLICYPLMNSYLILLEIGQFEMADYFRYLEGLLLFFILYNRRFAESAYRMLFLGMSASVLFSILYNHESIIAFLQGNLTFFNNPFFDENNYASSYYIIIIAFLCGNLASKSKETKIFTSFFHWISIAILSFALILSTSRSAYLSIAILAIVFIALYFKQKKLFSKVLVTIGLLGVGIYTLPKFSDLFDIMLQRFINFQNPYADGAADPRFFVWREAIDLFFLRPWGIGLSNVRNFTEYQIPEHNTILQVMSTFGIFSVIIFAYLLKELIYFFKSINTKKRIDITILLIVLSYVPFLLSLNLMTSRHFWIILAFFLSRNYLNKLSFFNNEQLIKNNNI